MFVRIQTAAPRGHVEVRCNLLSVRMSFALDTRCVLHPSYRPRSALTSLRLDYLRSQDDAVVPRIITKSCVASGRQASDVLNQPSLPVADVSSEVDAECLNSSPLPPLHMDGVRAIFHQYFPQEPWPLDEMHDRISSSPTRPSESELEELPLAYRTDPGAMAVRASGRSALRDADGLEHERVVPAVAFSTQTPALHNMHASPRIVDEMEVVSKREQGADLTMEPLYGSLFAPAAASMSSAASASHMGHAGSFASGLDAFSSSVSGEPLEPEPRAKGTPDWRSFYIPGSYTVAPSPNASPSAQPAQGALRTTGMLAFSKTSIEPAQRTHRSLLSAKLQHNDVAVAQTSHSLSAYARIGASDNDANGVHVTLYFPDQQGSTPSVRVCVQQDASMDELIGYGLYCYEERFGEPPRHGTDHIDMAKAEAWSLRMVECGVVDEDYPAIDRSLTVRKFGKDAFAICPQRSSRLLSALSTIPHASSTAPDSVLLQIMVVPTARGTTIVRVPRHAHAADVVRIVCHACHLSEPSSHVLFYRDVGDVIRDDCAVASLFGRTDLALVERGSLSQAPAAPNPGANSEVQQQPKYQNAMDLISNYKAYSVSRRHPISVGRHERVITIDGEYIHIIRPAEKHFFHARSTSYHISAVLQCDRYPRYPNQFKIVVARDNRRDTKRYDFEADDKHAAGMYQRH